MEFHSPEGPLPHIPDDLSIPQFIFDYEHPTKPLRKEDTPWLIDDGTGRKIGTEELKTRVTGLANALWLKHKIGRDSVVLVFSRNHIDYPVAIWAIHRLGGIISGANPDFSENELLYQIREANASLLLVHPDSLTTAVSAARQAGLPLERVVVFNTGESVAAPTTTTHDTIDELVQYGVKQPISFTELTLQPGEAKTKLAFLSFSSGTTGRPKAVAIPHFSLIANVIQLAAHAKVNQDYAAWEDQRYRPGDVAIAVLPLYHIYGLVINLHLIMHAGMSLVVVPKFTLVGMLESIVRYHITHLFLVPPHVVQLCKHPAVKNYDLRSHIRMIMCGAAPLTHELNHQLFEMLPNAQIGQAYGMTETCTATIAWPISQKHGVPGSSGHLVPGTIARVVKFDGSLAGYDEAGELWIKTPSVALGYANNKKATDETFIDGWVRTGDEVVIDINGEVKVLDRIKEIMKVRGFQVAPAELEGCLLEHSDISNACVVGIPDDYSGEVPLAFVALNPQALEKARDPRIAEEIKKSIIKHVADNKVYYKRLTGGVEIIPLIPTSPSGKLLRRILREEAKKLRKSKAKL